MYVVYIATSDTDSLRRGQQSAWCTGTHRRRGETYRH